MRTGTGIGEGMVDGLLVGAEATVAFDVTTNGDVAIGAGKREAGGEEILPSGGELIVEGGNFRVNGSLYAGGSGRLSFPDYVISGIGENGKLNIRSGGEVKITNDMYMGYEEGSYDAEVTVNGTLNVGGSLCVGYFSTDGEVSGGGMDGEPQSRLTLGNGAEVRAQEIEVGNGGQLIVQGGANLTVSGQVYVPSDEKDAELTIEEGGIVTAQSVQIGSLYGSAQIGTVSVQIDGTLNLTGEAENSLCIASGKVEIGNNAIVRASGKVQIGSGGMAVTPSTGEAREVSFTMNGQLNITNGAALSVMKDAGNVHVNGRITAAQCEIASAVTVGEDGSLEISGTTEVGGDVVLTNKNELTGGIGRELSLGAVSVRAGTLRLESGEVTARKVSIQTSGETALQIEKNAALYVEESMQTGNDEQKVVVNGKLSVGGTASLGRVILGNKGSFEINGQTSIGYMELYGDETGQVGLKLNDKLTVNQTYIGTDVILANTVTSEGEGSLGEILIGSGNTLRLGGQVRVDAITMPDSEAKIIVRGKKNNIGAVLIYGTDRAEIGGAGTQARDYWNEGYTKLSGSLTVYDEESGTGEYLNNGRTVFAITQETAAIGEGTSMLSVKSMTGDGTVSVQIDLTDRAVQSLVGKQINFITEDGQLKQLHQEQIEHIIPGTARDATFVPSTDGVTTEESGHNYILIEYRDGEGKAKAFGYHYRNEGESTAGEGATEAHGNGYFATGIEFDRFYSRVHAREDGQGDIMAAEREYESEWSGNNIVIRRESGGTEAEEAVIAANITVTGNSEGEGAPPAISELNFLERREGATQLTPLGRAERYKMNFREDAEYTGAADGSGVLGFAASAEQGGSGAAESIQPIDSIAIAEGVKITLDNLAMNAKQSLSMGEGSELTIKNATVTIGGGETTEISAVNDTSGTPIGNLNVENSPGENSPLSAIYRATPSEINGASIRIMAENRDAALLFQSVTDTNNTPVIRESTMNDTAITLSQTNGVATLGSNGETAVPIVLRGNSSVNGTGRLNNITFENTTLYYTMNSTMDGVNESITFGQGTRGTVRLAWASNNANMPNADYYGESAVGRTIRLDRYSEAGLQVDAAPMTNELNQTALTYGYLWRYSQDALILGEDIQADAQRIANTMISSTAAVLNFGRNAREQANNGVSTLRTQPAKATKGIGKGIRLWTGCAGEALKRDTAKRHRGFEYKASGYAVGCDTEIDSQASVLGIAIGQTFGENTPNAGNGYYTAGKIEQDTLMCGIYGAHNIPMKDKGQIVMDFYAACGKTECASRRESLVTGKSAEAEWNETAFGIGAGIAYARAMRNNTYMTPYLVLEYSTCTTDSFTEHGHSDVNYSGSTYSNATLTLGIALSKAYTVNDGQTLTPYIRIAYRGDIVRHDAKTTALSHGQTQETETSHPTARNAIGINMGTNWQIAPHWGMSIGYAAEIRNAASDQSLTACLNYTF